MAYLSKETKAKIVTALKLVVPKDWKYSLRVHNHIEISMVIKSAPIDLVATANARDWNPVQPRTYVTVNDRCLDRTFDGEMLEIMQKIVEALNIDNYNNSDSQIDYFDVGHYVNLSIGHILQPFVVKAK